MNNIRIINTNAFIKAIHQLDGGEKPFAELSAKDFEVPFSTIEPIEGYKTPENKDTKAKLPNCCPYHKQLFNEVSDWYDKFPHCCELHQKLSAEKWFNKDNYKNIADKVVTQIAYTEHLIATQINNDDWFKDITDYLEANVSSFGQLPAGHGNPVGLNFYLGYLKSAFESRLKEIPKEKKKRLSEFLDRYYGEMEESQSKTNLNLLHSTYQKWLKSFPFEISYLKHLKQHFEKKFPILDGQPELNKYTGISKAKLQTPAGLVEALLKTTENLLTQINGLALHEKGLITDPINIQIELLNEKRRLELNELKESPGEDRQEYIKLIKKWLKGEKRYFKELTPLLNIQKANSGIETQSTSSEAQKNQEQDIQKMLEEFKKVENKFWKGIPMDKVVIHFIVFVKRKNKNKQAFLTNEQFVSFIQKAFFNDEQQPKHKINFGRGEKGFVIKRFYEFFELAVTQYGEANKKDKYIDLAYNNFSNLGTRQTVVSLFKSDKTKEKW